MNKKHINKETEDELLLQAERDLQEKDMDTLIAEMDAEEWEFVGSKWIYKTPND